MMEQIINNKEDKINLSEVIAACSKNHSIDSLGVAGSGIMISRNTFNWINTNRLSEFLYRIIYFLKGFKGKNIIIKFLVDDDNIIIKFIDYESENLLSEKFLIRGVIPLGSFTLWAITIPNAKFKFFAPNANLTYREEIIQKEGMFLTLPLEKNILT